MAQPIGSLRIELKQLKTRAHEVSGKQSKARTISPMQERSICVVKNRDLEQFGSTGTARQHLLVV